MPEYAIEILASGRTTCTPDWSYTAPVFVDYGRLYFLHKGSLRVGMGETPHHLTAPRTYLLPGRMWATGTCPRRTELSWVHFRPVDTGLDLLLAERDRPVGWDRAVWRPWEHVIDRLPHVTEAGNPDHPTQLFVQSLVLYAIALTLKATRGTTHTRQRTEALRRLQPTLLYMKSNLKRPLDLDQLSRVAGLSTAQLNRLFRQALHLSPHQYLIDLRMLHARQLLRGSPHSIQQIADEVGYCNPFYFSRAFHQAHGLSPRAYRQAWPGTQP